MSSTQPLGDYHFVLMHGFANTSAEFSRLYDWLREHGYDVTSVTLPFHSSEEDFREFDIDVFMTDFQSELQSVLQGKDLKRVVLISTSLSSLALINAKMSLVGVKHVMLAPYLGTGSWRSRLLGLFDRILPKLWFSRRRDVDLRSDRGDFALSQKLKVGAAMQVERLAQRVGLESSGYPNGTLVIHSHADTVAAFRNSSQFFEKNRGDSDFVTLLGAPHSFANNLDLSNTR
jgi:esterase/lipase